MDDKDVQLKLQNDLLASIHNSNIKLQIENDELKEKVNRFNITKLEKDNKSLKGSCKSLGRKINNQREELRRLIEENRKLKQELDEIEEIEGLHFDHTWFWINENNKLKERINKAIEIINNTIVIKSNDDFIELIYKIHEILKGEK